MKLPVRIVGWALPLFLSGCFFHHTKKVANQQLAPPVQDKAQLNTTPVDLPPTATTIPAQPTENATAPSQRAPRPHHRRKPAEKAASPAQESASVVPDAIPAVSAIGQLSSGDPAHYRNETVESINTIERGLNGLNRSLSSPEEKTAEQIREYLKEARLALASGDVDGAHTLAAKAKVLLAELTK